jgi:hypothetical protein
MALLPFIFNAIQALKITDDANIELALVAFFHSNMVIKL